MCFVKTGNKYKYVLDSVRFHTAWHDTDQATDSL